MGWGFRKSINFGPLRINASKSGLGYSIGGRGFRVGRDARGRQYRSLSIPGTGIFNRTYAKKAIGNQNSAVYNRSAASPGTTNGSAPSQRMPILKIGLYLLAAGLIYLLLGMIRHLF